MKPLSSSPPSLVLLPFYCACILLLGADLYQDRCCDDVREQIEAMEARTLQGMDTRLSQLQDRLGGLESRIEIGLSPQLPGTDLGDFLEQLGIGTLTDLLANGIASFIQGKDQARVRQEIRNQIFNHYELRMARQGNPRIAIYFDSGTATVPPSGRQILESFRGTLQRRPGRTVVISGFADRVGRLDQNRKLARERALAVRELLQGAQAKIVIASAGAEDHLPIPTPDEISEPRNRVVLVHW